MVKTKKAEDYIVQTNIDALSKITDLLYDSGLDALPILDLEDNDEFDVVSYIELLLIKNPDKFNTFLRIMTATQDDFTSMPLIHVDSLVNSFFDQLPSKLKSMIETLMKESMKQKTLDILKNQENMAQAMSQGIQNFLKDQLEGTENLETSTENTS